MFSTAEEKVWIPQLLGVGEDAVEVLKVGVVSLVQRVEQREAHPVVHPQVRRSAGRQDPHCFDSMGESVPQSTHPIEAPRDDRLAARRHRHILLSVGEQEDRARRLHRGSRIRAAPLLVGDYKMRPRELGRQLILASDQDYLPSSRRYPTAVGVTAGFKIRELNLQFSGKALTVTRGRRCSLDAPVVTAPRVQSADPLLQDPAR